MFISLNKPIVLLLYIPLIGRTMAENNTTERARALRAEKQVEKLERELELIKSRLKVSEMSIVNQHFLVFT